MHAIIASTKKMSLQLYADDLNQLVLGEAADIIFAELHRMSVFHICCDHEAFLSNVSLLRVNHENSFLESFALMVLGSPEELTVGLFGGEPPPRLTKLSLGGCKLNWDSWTLNNLTSLSH